ncbi:MAG: tetratricopeptide repeat protein, partial [archaeon]
MMHSNMFFKIVIVIISFLITTNLFGVSAQEYIDYDKCYNEAISYGQIGERLFSNGQWDDAIEYYNKTLQTFESCGDEYNKAVTLMKIGVVYAHKNELDTALRYLQESYDIFLKDEEIDESEIATMANMGKVYLMKGESDKAIESFNKALSWSEERNDTRGMALAIANIGGYYREMGDYPTAIEYHLQAADLFNKSGDLREQGGQLRNVGFAYYLSNDFEESLYYYDEAEYFFSIINDDILLDYLSYLRGLSYNSIATYNKRIDNFNESIKYSELALSESIKAQRSGPNGFILGINTLLEMGDVYSLQGYHENAIDSYQTALYFLEVYKRGSETTDED